MQHRHHRFVLTGGPSLQATTAFPGVWHGWLSAPLILNSLKVIKRLKSVFVFCWGTEMPWFYAEWAKQWPWKTSFWSYFITAASTLILICFDSDIKAENTKHVLTLTCIPCCFAGKFLLCFSSSSPVLTYLFFWSVRYDFKVVLFFIIFIIFIIRICRMLLKQHV